MERNFFDALLCDIDGVVRIWDDSMDRVDESHGLSRGTLASIAFDPERLTPAITGAITDEQWRESVATALGAHIGSDDLAAEVVAAWSKQSGAVDADVVDLLTELRQEMPVVFVSNATTRLDDDLAALGLLDVADGVVNSSRVGVAKPDREIYLAAAELADAHPERCVFVDDTLRMVDGARDAGMTAIHYTGISSLRRAVSQVPSRP
jgi:putative hydrolase of the HAD superfamily